MAFELERKFYLKSIPEDAQRLLTRDKAQTLRQGYLSSNPTIRVRIDSSRSRRPDGGLTDCGADLRPIR